MKKPTHIAFRSLTNADFYNIYKPTGSEPGGGGQTYIDFPTSEVTVANWQDLFSSVNGLNETQRTSGPAWSFPVRSIGFPGTEILTLFQRRPQSVSVSSQRIGSSRSRRIRAWHPAHGFPVPADPSNRDQLPPGLTIYLIKDDENEIWAGWFFDVLPYRDPGVRILLEAMVGQGEIEGNTGFIKLENEELLFDEMDPIRPFLMETQQAEVDQIDELLFELDLGNVEDLPEEEKISLRKVRNRNTRATRALKRLYGGRCQISGEDLTFVKKNGELYSEAHHLIPLGEDGSDMPSNIIVVSPLIHSMLHYADVSQIDLGKMSEDNTLEIVINGENHTIRWHPDHAALVLRSVSGED